MLHHLFGKNINFSLVHTLCFMCLCSYMWRNTTQLCVGWFGWLCLQFDVCHWASYSSGSSVLFAYGKLFIVFVNLQ